MRQSRADGGCTIIQYSTIGAGTEIARASRLAVARLGLGTASLFGKLASHRSGVRFSAHANKFACCTRTGFTSFTLCGYGESNSALVLGKDAFYH